MYCIARFFQHRVRSISTIFSDKTFLALKCMNREEISSWMRYYFGKLCFSEWNTLIWFSNSEPLPPTNFCNVWPIRWYDLKYVLTIFYLSIRPLKNADFKLYLAKYKQSIIIACFFTNLIVYQNTLFSLSGKQIQNTWHSSICSIPKSIILFIFFKFG